MSRKPPLANAPPATDVEEPQPPMLLVVSAKISGCS